MYIAIDIGGTKIDIGFFKTKDPSSKVKQLTIKTEQNFDIAKNILIKEIRKQCLKKIEGIGVSFAGIISEAGQIVQTSNLPDYKNKPLLDTLSSTFNTNTFVVQDSTCSAIAEVMYGNIKHYKRIVHLILGTGLGGTFIHQDEVQIAISPIEPGGLIIDFEGRRHKFNRTEGLLEAYVGGGSLENYYQVDLSKTDDNDNLWSEITDHLAVGLNNINCLLKPEIIIIGGGIGIKRKNALKIVIEKFKQYNEFAKPCEIAFTEIEGNSSLIGALAVNFVDNLKLNT